MLLREWLSQNNVTQEALAKKVRVTQGRIHQVLEGDLPSMPLAMRIQKATNGDVAPEDHIRNHRRRAAA